MCQRLSVVPSYLVIKTSTLNVTQKFEEFTFNLDEYRNTTGKAYVAGTPDVMSHAILLFIQLPIKSLRMHTHKHTHTHTHNVPPSSIRTNYCINVKKMKSRKA